MARSASLKNIARLLDEVKEEIPVEKSFLSDLQRSIEMSDKKNSRPPSKTVKPSSMHCIRNMYFQVMGQDRDDTATGYCLVGICNSGSDIHERIQDAVADMKNNGIDCEYVDVGSYVESRNLKDVEVVAKQGNETKLFHTKLNMSFLCDGIVRYRGKYYILEIKTENSYKWQNRKGVDEGHFHQATAYSEALGLDNVIFVYISRDNLAMKSYLFPVTPEMRNELVTKINRCLEYVAQKVIPPKEETKKGCTYCSYKETCSKYE